tara:strand:- start:1010 stop:2041 length:1032 start_codon:yes stop_codon:yes gene_type:complete
MSRELVNLKDINIHHNEEWTEDVENILEKMRINCVNLSEYHRKRYHHYEGYLKYFRIPVIILSAINSVFAVGLQPYMEQSAISITNCFVSMICGIITSIELYLSIQSNMENELSASKDFYILGVDIYKTLNLNRENRGGNQRSYLDEKHAQYCKLIETSNLLVKKIKDALSPIPPSLLDLSSTATSPNSPINTNKLDRITDLHSTYSTEDEIVQIKKKNKKEDLNKDNIFNQNIKNINKNNDTEIIIGQFYHNSILWKMKKTIDDTLYYIMDKTGHSQWDDPRNYGIINFNENKTQNDNSSILTKATNIVKNITKKNSELKEPSAVNTEYDDTFESDDSFNEP